MLSDVLAALISVIIHVSIRLPSGLPCVFQGLPAFKPGEKVEIDFGMDDF